jgi:hypothetical protein
MKQDCQQPRSMLVVDQPSRDGDAALSYKHHSASALYDAAGRVLAVADPLWIELLDSAAFGR